MDEKFPDWDIPTMENTEETLFQQRVQERMDSLGKKAAPFSKELGKSDSFIRDILRRQTTPIGDNLLLLARGLQTTADYLLGRTDDPAPSAVQAKKITRIVGRAGAATDGRVEFSEASEGLGWVEVPEGASEESVALEVTGYSQGFIADGCLIFYTEVHAAPTEDMLGTIVVVGTDDNQVLLKKLLRGSKAGLYDLESINGPMLKDRRVIWAAHVDSLVPPWRAKRLRVDATEIKL